MTYILDHWQVSSLSCLAQAKEGSESGSTASNQEEQRGKPRVPDKGGERSCFAPTIPSLGTRLSRDVRRLEEESDAMGALVTTSTKEGQQRRQEEGRDGKGAARGRCVTGLRCYTKWIIFYIICLKQLRTAGRFVLQGVCELRQGDQIASCQRTFRSISPTRARRT